MKQLFPLLMTLFFLKTSLFSYDHEMIYPTLDLVYPHAFPKNFRTMNPAYSATPLPSELGLEQLQASGSGQFDEKSLKAMLEYLPTKKITVIDLREESHGFADGVAIFWKLPDSTWTNKGMTGQEVDQDELLRLRNLVKQGHVLLDPIGEALKLDVSYTSTEKKLVESIGLIYDRIPVTENHHPRNPEIDYFVKLIMNLTDRDWLHLHCHGGRGRTTLFLNMYDMLLNAPNVSFEDILARQNLLGGTYFYRLREPHDRRNGPVMERVKFLKDFYEYCCTCDPKIMSWSEWIVLQPQDKE